MRTLLFLLAVLFCENILSQNNLQLVNASSTSTGNIENNTGEIFVVYNFSGINSNRELTNSEDTLLVNKKAGIIIFPNPVQNVLNYVVKDDFKFVNVKVYDYNQKLLFTQYNNNTKIDFTNFPVGLYTVIFNDNPLNGFKIIKR